MEFKAEGAAEAGSGEFGEGIAAAALAGGGEGATAGESCRWRGDAKVSSGISRLEGVEAEASASAKAWATASPSRKERGGGPDATK
jgi:hypothetical protein